MVWLTGGERLESLRVGWNSKDSDSIEYLDSTVSTLSDL
jgi:hypothetical protein